MSQLTFSKEKKMHTLVVAAKSLIEREPICDRLIIPTVCLKILQCYILRCLYAPSDGTEEEGRTMMAFISDCKCSLQSPTT